MVYSYDNPTCHAEKVVEFKRVDISRPSHEVRNSNGWQGNCARYIIHTEGDLPRAPTGWLRHRGNSSVGDHLAIDESIGAQVISPC